MKPTVFIARSWGNTRLHEGQLYILQKEESPTGWWCTFDRADSSPYSHFMGISGNPGPSVWPEHGYDDDMRKLLSSRYNEGRRFRVNLQVVYMDDMNVCPFCGEIHGVLQDFGKNDKRKDQWDKLRGMEDDNVSYGNIAVAELIANINKHTRPFLYKMCADCRSHWRRPLLSGCVPENKRFNLLPYEKVALEIWDTKERNMWWETKLICHGRKLPTIAFPCVKKAIARRLRRKSLSRQEHEYLSMMMSVSSIKRLLA